MHMQLHADDGRAPDPSGSPSAYEAVALALANAALSVIVQTGSEVGADEGGCSPTRARARCACRLSRIRSAVSTPATPAIAAKEGSRCGRSRRRTLEGVEMRTFGEYEGPAKRRRDTSPSPCLPEARDTWLGTNSSASPSIVGIAVFDATATGVHKTGG